MAMGVEGSTASGPARRSASGVSPTPALPVSPPSPELQIPGLITSDTVLHAGRHAPLAVPPVTSDESPSSEIIVRLFPPTRDSAPHLPEFNPSGLELGHFRIEERIGMGGMGAVFRALDLRLQRHVALKLLAPSQTYDAASVKRFENEARAAARLDHDNVARVYFIGEERGLHFIAFEFVTGSTIRDLIRRQGRLSPLDTVNYALQIAYALKHTSAMGVVHRDIKPSNIIITPNGRAKLVDLGLARKESNESADLTISGTTLGTFDYISPEQAKDPRSVDVRSDIYSLGCTIYHMLTGQPPYPEGTALQKLLDHQNKEAPNPQALNAEVSPALATLVRKMMSSDRNKRHQTPDHLIRELSAIGASMGLRGVHPEGLVWLTSRAMHPPRWTSQIGWLMTAVVLLAGVALLQAFPQISRRLAGDSGSSSAFVPRPSNRSDQPTNSAAANNDDAESNGSTASDNEPPAPGDRQHLLASDTHAERTMAAPFTTERATSPDIAAIPSRTPNEGKGTESSTAATDGAGNSKIASGRTSTNSAASSEAVPESSTFLTVFNASGANPREYRTLESACAAVEDGGTIELRFNGRRIEKPCRLDKKNVTLRAARSFRPVVHFAPAATVSTPSESRFLTIQASPVSIVNVQFEMSLPADATGNDYALFGLQHPGQLHLSGVLAAVHNPRDVAASIVSLGSERSRSSGDMPRMAMMPFGETAVALIDVSGSLLKGRCSLATIDCQGETQVVVKESALAFERDAITVGSMSATLPEKTSCKISLEHVTSFVKGHFIRISNVGQGEQRFTVRCQSRNSIFNPWNDTPLVSMSPAVSGEDAYRSFVWTGERNFFGQSTALWQVAALEKSMKFEEWTEYWGLSNEVGSNNEEVFWEFELARDFSDLGPEAFLLSDVPNQPNPPLRNATDGRDAGCDPLKLPTATTDDE